MSNVYEAAFLALRDDIRAEAERIAESHFAAAGMDGMRDAPLSGEWAGEFHSGDIQQMLILHLAEIVPNDFADIAELDATNAALCDDFENAYSDWFAEAEIAEAGR